MKEYMTTIEKVINGDYLPHYSRVDYKDIAMEFSKIEKGMIKLYILGGPFAKKARLNLWMSIEHLKQLPDPLAIIHDEFNKAYKELESRTP